MSFDVRSMGFGVPLLLLLLLLLFPIIAGFATNSVVFCSLCDCSCCLANRCFSDRELLLIDVGMADSDDVFVDDPPLLGSAVFATNVSNPRSVNILSMSEVMGSGAEGTRGPVAAL